MGAIYELVKFLTPTVGTSASFEVGAAIDGGRAPEDAGVSDGEEVSLAIFDPHTGKRVIGTGTYDADAASFAFAAIVSTDGVGEHIELNGRATVFSTATINDLVSGEAAVEAVASDVAVLQRSQGLAALLAQRRAEAYAAGWFPLTTRDPATRTFDQTFEPGVGSYNTNLRDTPYPVTIGTAAGAPVNVTYPVPHGRTVGDRVVISGCATADYNATKIVTAVTNDLVLQIDYGGAFLAAPGGSPVATAYGTVFNALDPAFRYSLPRECLRGYAGVDWIWDNNIALGPDVSYANVAGVPYSTEFMLDDDQLELALFGGGVFDIYVDGSLLALSPAAASAVSYPLCYYKYAFAKRKPRHIRVFCDGAFFAGAAGRRKNAISPVTGLRRLRAAILSDSFGEGTLATINGRANRKISFGHLLCERMGWEPVNFSVGSTGIATDGGGADGKKKYIDRLYELVGCGIDLVLVHNSVNGSPSQAQCEALFDAIPLVAPGAKIIGLGRVWTNETPGAQNLADDLAFKAACDARQVPFVDGGIGTLGLPLWVTAGNKATYYNGTQATATTALTANAVSSATVTNAGVGYDFFNTPAAVLSGGGGTGAALTPVWNAEVTAIQVLDGGFGYTVAPTVVIENGATALARYSGGIVSVTVIEPGGGYTTAPVVSFSGGGGGTGAAATAVIEGGRVVRIDLTSAGSGYSSAPTVTIASSTTNATGTATISGGAVTGVTITGAGSFYTSVPRVRFVPHASGGQGAVAVAHVAKKLSSLTVAAGGSGYTTPPAVTIAHPTAGDVTHPKCMGHMMIAERYGAQIDALP